MMTNHPSKMDVVTAWQLSTSLIQADMVLIAVSLSCHCAAFKSNSTSGVVSGLTSSVPFVSAVNPNAAMTALASSNETISLDSSVSLVRLEVLTERVEEEVEEEEEDEVAALAVLADALLVLVVLFVLFTVVVVLVLLHWPNCKIFFKLLGLFFSILFIVEAMDGWSFPMHVNRADMTLQADSRTPGTLSLWHRSEAMAII